ncbi:MAG: VOC family protein, partial [Actinomycetota bacterium]|nr:VOC family protein [Actinomycetota bacterium]
MIDHTGVIVGSFEASSRFYAAALAPLGYELLLEFHASVAGFGEPGKPHFWFAQGEPNTPRIHVAFRADTRREVDAFYEAALGA